MTTSAAPTSNALRGDLPHDIPGLDAIRGLAAAAVLATHVGFLTGETSSGVIGALVSRLDYGVAIFFLLSGFLLVRPWMWHAAGLGGRVELRRYYLKRFLRIMPLYWLVLIIVIVAIPANRDLGVPLIAANAALVQIYVPDPLPQAFTQTWSLATEASFYLLLPLLAWIVISMARRRWNPASAIGVLAVFAVLSTFFVVLTRWPDSPIPIQAGYWLPYSLLWFALGMLLAVLQTARLTGHLPRASRLLQDAGRYLGTCWMVAAAAFLLAATPIGGPRGFEAATDPWTGAIKLWLYGISAFFVLLPLIAQPVGETPARRVLQSKPARWLADTSYGVFLWHLLVIEGVMWALDIEVFTGGFWLILTLTYVATVMVSWISYRTLERPMMLLAHRRRLPTTP